MERKGNNMEGFGKQMRIVFHMPEAWGEELGQKKWK